MQSFVPLIAVPANMAVCMTVGASGDIVVNFDNVTISVAGRVLLNKASFVIPKVGVAIGCCLSDCVCDCLESSIVVVHLHPFPLPSPHPPIPPSPHPPIPPHPPHPHFT